MSDSAKIFFRNILFYSLSHLKFIDKSLEIIKSLEKNILPAFQDTWKWPKNPFFDFSLARGEKMGPRRKKSYRDDPPLNHPKNIKKS